MDADSPPKARRRARAAEDDAEPFEPALPGDDEDEAGESEYRRRSRPVRVQKRGWGAPARRRLRLALKVLLWSAVILVPVMVVQQFLTHSAEFTIAGSDQIQVTGVVHASPTQILERFASDLGRNIFFVPLAARQAALEQIPWVRSATVLRLWPNRLQVRVAERTPVAYARVGDRLELVDADGVLLDLPEGMKFTAPVLIGLQGTAGATDANPPTTPERRRQMQLYVALMQALDSDGSHHSLDLSEIDLSDPEDVQATVTLTSGEPGTVLLHLGTRDFLKRYRLYLAHIQEWRQSFAQLNAVDLRYDGQAIINSGTNPAVPPAPTVGPPAAAAPQP